jgi:hypothetical protein
MTWIFQGRVVTKQVLPRNKRTYSIEVTGHDSNDHDVFEPSWVRTARFSFEITTLENAMWHIGNGIGAHAFTVEDVTTDSPSPVGDVAWMEYWPESKHISVIFGCSETTFNLIENDLNYSLHSEAHNLVISFSGMFDCFDNNELSNQPSVDEFEAGRPFPFDPDVRFRIVKAVEEKK